jgi:hypothetical protein
MQHLRCGVALQTRHAEVTAELQSTREELAEVRMVADGALARREVLEGQIKRARDQVRLCAGQSAGLCKQSQACSCHTSSIAHCEGATTPASASSRHCVAWLMSKPDCGPLLAALQLVALCTAGEAAREQE